ncbi:MAG: glycosyltransferase [Candidatus Neomarinimicrobiota bacterium]
MDSQGIIGAIVYANPDELPPTVNTVEILAEQGYDVIVIARNQNRPQWQYPENVRVYRLGDFGTSRKNEEKSSRSKVIEYYKFIKETKRLVRRHNCSLLIAYDMFGFLTAYKGRPKFQNRIPIIYHNHDLSFPSMPWSLAYWVKQFELKHARWADAVVFPQEDRARLFRKDAHLSEKPIIVPNYPRLRNETPEPVLRRRLAESGVDFRFLVLRYGSMGDDHCIPETIEAVASLPEDYIAVFCGFGSSVYVEKMKKKAEQLGVSNRVFFFLDVSYDEWFGYIASADVGLAIYRDSSVNLRYLSTAGNKLFLYAMCGVPAIVPNSSDFRRLVTEYGLGVYADSQDPQELAKAIRKVTRPEKQAEFSSRGREAHLRHLNYDLAIKPLVEKIRSLTRGQIIQHIVP